MICFPFWGFRGRIIVRNVFQRILRGDPSYVVWVNMKVYEIRGHLLGVLVIRGFLLFGGSTVLVPYGRKPPTVCALETKKSEHTKHSLFS